MWPNLVQLMGSTSGRFLMTDEVIHHGIYSHTPAHCGIAVVRVTQDWSQVPCQNCIRRRRAIFTDKGCWWWLVATSVIAVVIITVVVA